MKELVNIQGLLKAPKNQYNSFGKYKYRSAEDILEGVKPLLQEYNCHLTISDDIVVVGNRIYVKATVTLRNSSGEEVTTTAFAREEETKKGMDASQVTGATSSYARKYALNGLFCIDDTKDADSMDNRQTAMQSQCTGQAGRAHQTGQVQQSDIDDLRLMALSDLGNANTVDDVCVVWRNYPALQNDVEFKSAVIKKGSLLKGVA